jgi:hypothetical protein
MSSHIINQTAYIPHNTKITMIKDTILYMNERKTNTHSNTDLYINTHTERKYNGS